MPSDGSQRITNKAKGKEKAPDAGVKSFNQMKSAQRAAVVENARKYPLGTHGAKKSEQQRLLTYGQPVSGATHQSEHPIQASVFAHKAGQTRAQVEKPLPAYQEIKEIHRAHAGTGTGTRTYETGFASAEEYREHQTNALDSNDISTAMQLQSLGNAFARQAVNLDMRKPENQIGAQQSDNSYEMMLDHMNQAGQIPYGSGFVSISSVATEEMRLARMAERTGQWPSLQEFDQAEARIRASQDFDPMI